MLIARPDANASTLVADVDSFRAAIITTLTDIVGVPPTAVSRLVLRLPDCTQLALEPRLPLNTTSTRRRRQLLADNDNDGTGAVPCTPTVDKLQVLLVVDTSTLGGNDSVQAAVARVGAVFGNTSAYAAAVGSLYTAWDAVANMTTNLTALRSVDLVFASDDASAVAVTSPGDDSMPTSSTSRLFRAGMTLLVLCIAAAVAIACCTRHRRSQSDVPSAPPEAPNCEPPPLPPPPPPRAATPDPETAAADDNEGLKVAEPQPPAPVVVGVRV